MIEADDKLSRVPGLGESYPIRVLKDSIPVNSQAVWNYQALRVSSAKSTQVRSEIETLRDSISTLLLLLRLLLNACGTVQAINLSPLRPYDRISARWPQPGQASRVGPGNPTQCLSQGLDVALLPTLRQTNQHGGILHGFACEMRIKCRSDNLKGMEGT